MHETTDAPDAAPGPPIATLAGLRARHRSLAGRLTPAASQLYELVEERRKLLEDTKAAEAEHRATWTRPGWVGAGEEDFCQRSGSDDSTAAIAAVESALRVLAGLDDTGAAEEQQAAAAWLPEGAELDADGVERLLLRERLEALPYVTAEAAQAIARATRAVGAVFGEIEGTYSLEGTDEEERAVEGLLAGALLRVEVAAFDAIKQLRHRLGEHSAEAGA